VSRGRVHTKICLVTGAASGIGKATAILLAEEDATVIASDVDGDAAERVAVSIRQGGGRAVGTPLNVTDESAWAAIIETILSAHHRLDVLVNNAGVYEMKPLEEITEEHFHKTFDINVLGLLLVSKEAAKHLGKGGSIINIGSAVTSLTPPGSAVYTATKGAVDAITGVLSRELGPKGIRVNSVNPGMVETEGAHTAGFIGSSFQDWATSATPLGRIGQPQDIAGVVTFLATDDAGWLTGQQLIASGGMQ
jgi:3-oxoacyl-[acyl-carrier protein] reductase